MRPTGSSRCVGGFFLAAVLLLAIYTRRFKILSNRVHLTYENNTIMVMFFNLTLHHFVPSVTILPSKWSVIASYIFYYPGRTVQVIIACRVMYSVMTILNPMEQPTPITPLFILLTFSGPQILKHWFTGIHVARSMGLILRFWAATGQIELLATLFCVSVSHQLLLLSILITLNCLIVLCNLKLVTYLQSSRTPTKYVLVIRMIRPI